MKGGKQYCHIIATIDCFVKFVLAPPRGLPVAIEASHKQTCATQKHRAVMFYAAKLKLGPTGDVI